MRLLGSVLLALCTFGVGATWGSAQATQPPNATPTVIAGNDLGFRIDSRKGATPVGTLVIRVNGRWVEPEFSTGVKGLVLSSVIILIALPFGVEIASGPLGFVLLILMASLWGVVYAGFMQLIAMKTRSAAATNSGGLIFFPLLFLTPNFVPRDMLTEPMEVAATLNPVTYLMEALRSLILVDLDWSEIWPGFAVIAITGALMLVLNVRMIQNYD